MNTSIINSNVNLSIKTPDLKMQKMQTEEQANLNVKNSNTNLGNGYNEKIDNLLGELNSKFKICGKELSYKLHEETNRYIVSVKDLETGDIIKEIPSEESLDLFAKMMEMSGLILDKKS